MGNWVFVLFHISSGWANHGSGHWWKAGSSWSSCCARTRPMRASASSRPASPSASPAVQVRPLIHLILSPTPLSTKMMMQWTFLSIHLLVFSEEHLHRAARHQLIRAIRGLNPNNHRILFYFSFLFWSVSMETKTKELFGTHISIVSLRVPVPRDNQRDWIDHRWHFEKKEKMNLLLIGSRTEFFLIFPPRTRNSGFLLLPKVA